MKEVSSERINLIQELSQFILRIKRELNVKHNFSLIKNIKQIFDSNERGLKLVEPRLRIINQEIDKKIRELVDKYSKSKIQTYRSEVDYKTIKDHFHLIIEINDFVFGDSITNMKEKFHMTDTTISQIAKEILNKKFTVRFKHTYSEEEIIELAEDIKEKDFENFRDPQLHSLIKYYRDIQNISSPNNIIRISKDFALWVKSLENDKLSLLLSDFKFKLNKDDFFKKIENINKNSEVAKYVIYWILESEESNRQIGNRAGVSKTTVMKYMNILKSIPLRITNKEINEIAKLILKGSINENDYKDFINPELQKLLKKYTQIKSDERYLIRPIHNFKIIGDFKDWITKNIPNSKQMINRIVLINRDNEILKCILYKMLINKWIPVDIANTYNIPRKSIQRSANFLGLYNTLSNQKLRDLIINKFESGDLLKEISHKANVSEELVNNILNIITEIKDFETGRSLTKIAATYGVSRNVITDIAKKKLTPILFDIRFNDTFFSKYRNIGILSHKCINLLLSKKLNVNYYSEISPFLYEDYRIDGLLINYPEFLLKLNSKKDIFNFKSDLSRYKFTLFDFTSNLSKNNVLNKIKKYYTPFTLFFIIGFTDMESKILELQKDLELSERERKLYTKNIRIIRYDLFTEIMKFDRNEIELFNKIIINNINVNKNFIDSNIDHLKKINNTLSKISKLNHIKELKNYLKKYKDLKKEFFKIQNYKHNKQTTLDDFSR